MTTKFNTVRIHTKFQTLFLVNYGGESVIVSNGNIFRWNPESNAGWVSVIEHGGNFIDGTEFRHPATSNGAWECTRIADNTDCHIITDRLYFDNDIPHGVGAVVELLNGTDHPRWNPETTNPIGGHNDEWIPVNQFDKLETEQ